MKNNPSFSFLHFPPPFLQFAIIEDDDVSLPNQTLLFSKVDVRRKPDFLNSGFTSKVSENSRQEASYDQRYPSPTLYGFCVEVELWRDSGRPVGDEVCRIEILFPSIRPSILPSMSRQPTRQALDPRPASHTSEPDRQTSEPLRPGWLALRPSWLD